MTKQYRLILLLYFISVFKLGAQTNRNIDSFMVLLSKEKTDTMRVKYYYKLCFEYSTINPAKAKELGDKALELATKINFKKGIAASLNNIGNIYYYSDDYKTAIDYYSRSLKIREEIGDKKGMSDNLNNIGVLYRVKSNFAKALEYFLKSLQVDEELKDFEGVAACYNNIGLIMVDLKNFPKAKEYYLKSKNTYEKSGNPYGSASALNNLALLYVDYEQRDSALTTFATALELYRKTEDKYGSASCLINIAAIYGEKGDYKKEREFALKSLELRKEVDDNEGIASCLLMLAKIEDEEKNYSKAKEYLTQALIINKKIENKQALANAYQTAAGIFYNNGSYKDAYEYYKLFVNHKDSLLTKESLKSMADIQVKYETEKKEKEIELLKQGNQIHELEINKQRTVIYSIAFVLLIIVAFSFFLFKALKERQKVNKNLEFAYSQIEEKNKHITDSINYAKRIQTAMLKDEEHTSMHLPPHFIILLPKDIVSGDFYWAMEKENYLYLAAADCTGHGVPGAFLTLLGTSFLNEITSSDEIYTPSKILDLLRDKIVKELGRQGQTKDGMDISLIRLDLKTNVAMWAGAYNPLWLLKKDAEKFLEIKADKQPVGYSDIMTEFTNNELQLEAGDQVYLFTDGFADQFGGEKGKKFKYKQIQLALLGARTFTMEEQKNHMLKVFKNWKGNLDQVDDVLLLGIKIESTHKSI